MKTKHKETIYIKGQSWPDVSAKGKTILFQSSSEDFQEAVRRYNIILPCLFGRSSMEKTTSARTMRRWIKKWRDAEIAYGCGYIGLLPRQWKKGNRMRKLSTKVMEILENFSSHSQDKLKSKHELYKVFARSCKRRRVVVPSYKTFIRATNWQSCLSTVQKRNVNEERRKKRKALFHKPPHESRPFEIARIYHIQLNIEIVYNGHNLGRPWATFLMDGFSSTFLAVYLAFDPPSHRSCMMALRECVRRHNRLPEIIVVGDAKELKNGYFETVLAKYECSKKIRPISEIRSDMECKRLFGRTKFNNLIGGKKTKVCRSLSALYESICRKSYEDGTDRAEFWDASQNVFPQKIDGARISNRFIPYDEKFRIFTLPTTKKGNAKVMPGLGIKISYIYYWSNSFLDPEIENRQVEVRMDSLDAGIAYAFVKGHWVPCTPKHSDCFAGHSQREIMLAARELHNRNCNLHLSLTITEQRLAEFLTCSEGQKILLEQRLRDRQMRKIHCMIDS